jgi:hypothetical protein
MQERRAVVRELAREYLRASKKERGILLDEVVRLTGFNRNYAARALRETAWGRRREPRPRHRKPTYGSDVLGPVKKIWLTLGGISGKRLAPFLPELVPHLEACGELRLGPEVREKLLSVSAATIDRLLAPERERLLPKARGKTKPGTLLKHQIPIRTFSEWDQTRPGFLEIDLVSHDGGVAEGDWIQTLDATDVATGWTETRACKNKAQAYVFPALLDITEALPFPLLGLDSDNGSEFINNHLVRFCRTHKVTFTRSRAYHKNDSCYVEQKNWTVVRRTVGYHRYDTQDELGLLNELYDLLRLLTNFFQPQMKLLEKTREGSRVRKRYDQAKTPYQRLMTSPDVPDQAKENLTILYRSLNPVKLQRGIGRLQERLFRIALIKAEAQRKEVLATPGYEYFLGEATNDSFEYISR